MKKFTNRILVMAMAIFATTAFLSCGKDSPEDILQQGIDKAKDELSKEVDDITSILPKYKWRIERIEDYGTVIDLGENRNCIMGQSIEFKPFISETNDGDPLSAYESTMNFERTGPCLDEEDFMESGESDVRLQIALDYDNPNESFIRISMANPALHNNTTPRPYKVINYVDQGGGQAIVRLTLTDWEGNHSSDYYNKTIVLTPYPDGN